VAVGSQPELVVYETLFHKNKTKQNKKIKPSQKRVGGAAQGISPEFKS
jgi:hypothetical protein